MAELAAALSHLPTVVQRTFFWGFGLHAYTNAFGARVLVLENTQAKLSEEALPTDCTEQIKGIRLILLPLLLMYYKELLAMLMERLCQHFAGQL